ncbi:MAG: thioredoxin family protein [Alphaproteobacteria bacterium]|nr:thioredoxin family protein [Alphaproteobacteria bacterium]
MPALETPQKDNKFKIIDFMLPGTDGQTHSLATTAGPRGTIVAFICNHCPYVKAVIDRFVTDCDFLADHGIGAVAIMPNDTEAYPADSFDNMALFARNHAFSFPYVLDESQEIARAYGAVCTPDIFGFNADGLLCYRGRVDSAGPKDAAPDTIRELRLAMLQIAQSGTGPATQIPSMGCSIKWRA